MASPQTVIQMMNYAQAIQASGNRAEADRYAAVVAAGGDGGVTWVT